LRSTGLLPAIQKIRIDHQSNLLQVNDSNTCRLCGGMPGKTYAVREMMLGKRDGFQYSECVSCGALQRVALDLDLTPYYPSTYYAFAVRHRGRLSSWARAIRNRLALSSGSPAKGLINRVRPHSAYPWIKRLRPTRETRILDVGCGTGRLLRELSEAGYQSLTGLDPFLPPTVETPPAVRMIRSSLEEMDGQFDIIMLHHSLEHIPDQQLAISAIARLLPSDGRCLIRIPTVSSYAWEHYRENWFQIDAPRHLVLHSIDSLRDLGESSGLVLEHLDFDSTESQVLWSERYRDDVAMNDESPDFSRKQRRVARALARRLNSERRGDQVAAYFRKAKPSAANPSGQPRATHD
jgi:SAM-dependent methyltransferase